MGIATEQLHQEISGWKSLLDYYRAENSLLQNRLSAAVDKHMSGKKLALAERFQNEFLRKDDIIHIFRHDIHLQEKALATELSPDNALMEAYITSAQARLRNNIYLFEKEFSRMKEKFHHYLLSVQPP